MHISGNILKATELYILNGWIAWYVIIPQYTCFKIKTSPFFPGELLVRALQWRVSRTSDVLGLRDQISTPVHLPLTFDCLPFLDFNSFIWKRWDRDSVFFTRPSRNLGELSNSHSELQESAKHSASKFQVPWHRTSLAESWAIVCSCSTSRKRKFAFFLVK